VEQSEKIADRLADRKANNKSRGAQNGKHMSCKPRELEGRVIQM
jgi:hypothetical protein